jgi:alpha-glucosidase (family GH31 glycosyl hydrolase)
MLGADGTVLWRETMPITWNTTSTFQTLASTPTEQFFGGGMQNGIFTHKGTSVIIEQGGGWDAGGRPNPAPFYQSTAGYGAYRNTFAIGLYNFSNTVVLRHDEYRFDAFYFYGPSIKQVLTGYCSVTGFPFMPPIWGLQLGDSDCYNEPKKNRSTSYVIGIADGYTENEIPAGWLLPNDGYGCGYTELEEVGMSLRARGYQLGLWTSTGLGNATWETSVAGSRVIKTDVGWVGDGYKFAIDAVKLATSILETYGNSRRYIWTVCGWASTQHYAVMWNGDNYGYATPLPYSSRTCHVHALK